jgi:4a-hydroxytetrahydrobiopterin dehydratase
MPRPGRLAPAEVERRLAGLPGWSLADGALCRSFRFADFDAAFAFMTRVALAAAALDHHPDWTNVWNRVDVRLLTHDAGGLSELDFALAERIDRAAAGSR